MNDDDTTHVRDVTPPAHGDIARSTADPEMADKTRNS